MFFVTDLSLSGRPPLFLCSPSHFRFRLSRASPRRVRLLIRARLYFGLDFSSRFPFSLLYSRSPRLSSPLSSASHALSFLLSPLFLSSFIALVRMCKRLPCRALQTFFPGVCSERERENGSRHCILYVRKGGGRIYRRATRKRRASNDGAHDLARVRHVPELSQVDACVCAEV